MSLQLPVVIVHTGNQLYLQKCIELNSLYNKVYLLGDDTNKETHPEFTHIDSLQTNEVIEFKSCFVNYSTNPSTYELNCFLRVFYIREFMRQKGFESVFHLDSDCILLEKLSDIFPETTDLVAYSLQTNQALNHMVGSIHNGLLTMKFCDLFIQLCFDIYKTKSKHHLIEPKIRHHTTYKIGGGICDMTLYYLLNSEGILHSIDDLNQPRMLYGEKCVFDHQLSSSYGFLGNNTYVVKDGKKELVEENNKKYVKTVMGEKIRLLSLHYQGKHKTLLTETLFKK